ncbi:hypothetical protein KUW19_00140 [Ferrimonas balearica]|uniref:hypothetical protein n=1 Tax=Ferrimonas balearica TaxID=44012 RepID=UPI001C938848|nr:hypothetical protein [Ferrimonas balearica]MBY6104890.1 hypothetical protein [Ferrimonas balearica]
MIVFGIDPDSKAHGVAVYVDGQLAELHQLDLWDTYRAVELQALRHPGKVLVAIEDVTAQSFVYGRNAQRNKAAHAKVANGVGRCQQAQAELERMLARLDVTITKHKPQAGNWAKSKPTFERLTGWTGRSNEDTRSAAYFGFITQRRIRR